MDDASDVTQVGAGFIGDISRRMVDDLNVELGEADALRIGEALAEAFKAGIRVGAAEIIASVREQVPGFEIHVHLHDVADDEL